MTLQFILVFYSKYFFYFLGKTTLIKSLTGDSKITPRDALFATLDVTVHGMKLPCNLTVLLVDTVGFISNIPVNLIAAFNSTLRDAIDAVSIFFSPFLKRSYFIVFKSNRMC